MNQLEGILTAMMMSLMSFLGLNIEEQKQTLPRIIEKISQTIPIPEQKSKETNVEKTDLKEETELEKEKIPTVSRKNQNTSAPEPTIKKETPNKSITLEDKIKSAVGNIFCTIIENGKVRKITGSAVAISPNGVMLTNAHVAEHLLIDNIETTRNINCFIRTGSPAKRAYRASVVFLPTEWVMANKNNLNNGNTTGTGENDYALIVLNEKIEGDSAPNLYFIEGNDNDFSNIGIILASYPAFNGNILDNALYGIIDKSEIRDSWRLNYGDKDLLGTAPTILAVNGSSGGAVADMNGKLIGIMVATTLDTYSNKPNMRLISFSYISKDIKAKTGKSLDYFIKNVDEESRDFLKGEGARLAQILISNSR